MAIKPPNLREQQFRIKFRGFDVKQVDNILDEAADYVEYLEDKVVHYQELMKAKDRELNDFREHSSALKSATSKANAAAKEIKLKADKEAAIIISKAELTAEKILNTAHNRLAQLHEDLTELKRQRTHFEVKLRAFIEAHLKFLDMEKESNRDLDEIEDKVHFIKRT